MRRIIILPLDIYTHVYPYSSDQIEEEMDVAWSTLGRHEKWVGKFNRKILRKRPVGRPKRRQEDNIKTGRRTDMVDCGLDLISRDRGQSRAVMNTIMSLRVIKGHGIYVVAERLYCMGLVSYKWTFTARRVAWILYCLCMLVMLHWYSKVIHLQFVFR
jgi:hypothetical protein